MKQKRTHTQMCSYQDDGSDADDVITFEQFSASFVGGDAAALKVQADVLTFVADNAYCCCLAGQQCVRDIEFELKPRRPLADVRREVEGLDTVVANFVIMDEATDAVTLMPLRFIAEQMVKPLLQERCFPGGKPFQTDTDCMIGVPRGEDFESSFSFAAAWNDEMVFYMTMYERNEADSTDVSCNLRLRFVRLNQPLQGRPYAKEYYKDEVYLPVGDDERFTLFTDDEDEDDDDYEVADEEKRKKRYAGFSVYGGQFVVDKIAATSLELVESFLKAARQQLQQQKPLEESIKTTPVLLLPHNNPSHTNREYAFILGELCELVRDRIDDLVHQFSVELFHHNPERKLEMDFDEGWEKELILPGEEIAFVVLKGKYFNVVWAYVLGDAANRKEGMLEITMWQRSSLDDE